MRDDNEYELLGSDEPREGETKQPRSTWRKTSRSEWLRSALVIGVGVILISLIYPSVRHALSTSQVDPQLRQAQLSQLKLLRGHLELLSDQGRSENLEALDNLEACLTGKTTCPKKPVVLSNYIYVGMWMEKASPGGEIIWLSSAIPIIREHGYFILHIHDYRMWVAMTRVIPDLIHMYWLDEYATYSCVYDPRCAAGYQAAGNGTDLSIGVPEDELGVIPLARLFTTTWWGVHPDSWGHMLAYQLGHRGDEVWTFNPLGPQWALTPYAYPNNTYVPWSIEKTCMQTEYLPHEERNDTALVYAKHAGIFHWSRIKPTFWDSELVHSQKFTFLSTAVPENDLEVPAGLTSLGLQTRPAYNALLSSVRAIVGIGSPNTSPSVYSALCEGTPVVVPIHVDKPQTEPEDFWGDRYSQHPMAVSLGPPYVYSYLSDNETQLIEAVKLAVDTAPGRYIPPNMKESWVRSKIKEVLATDFEALAAQVIANNGGQVPRTEEKIRLHLDERLIKVASGKQLTWVPRE